MRLDRALAEHPSERFCTLVVARLLREGDDWVLLGSAGGHPLPLVRHPDGTTAELGRHGSLLGILAAPVFSTFRPSCPTTWSCSTPTESWRRGAKVTCTARSGWPA